MLDMGLLRSLIRKYAPGVSPETIAQAVDDWLDDHPEATTTVEDGSITEEKLASALAAKISEIDALSEAIAYKTPEEFGAKGDGTTDDSQAVQDAVDAGYAVRFADNKTYFLGDTVTIDHDCHLVGGKNTVIKTETPSGGDAPDGIVISGTLKKTTTMTSNYSAVGSETANAGNRLKLTDMTGINIGDIIVISATDQYYSYNRQYYYLGGTLMVAEKDSDYLYMSDAMPWDIENTASVSVKVYSAPVAIVENLNFISDNDTTGKYKYCVTLQRCKNSEVKNCGITEMDNGVLLHECVNTLVDCVNVSQASGANDSPLKDHYGVAIYSCSNTVISRIMSECANSCVDLSGQTPNMNTYIRNCNLFGSNRVDGLGMHENAYNTVVEDCVIGGIVGYGTLKVNRCRFVQRNKVAYSNIAISFRGSHNPEWAKLMMTNCTMEGDNLTINIAQPSPQNPIQAYDNVVGEVIIRDCVGGTLRYIPGTDSTVLSNTIKRIILDGWRDCYEIYHTSGSTIENMLVKDCTFKHTLWINNHNNQFCFDGIEYCHLVSDHPEQDRLFVALTKKGGRFNLPKDVTVTFSSNDTSARYMICGKNIAPDSAAEYAVGTVSGTQGNDLTRNTDSEYANALSVDASGNIVFENVNTNNRSVYLKCFAYVDETSLCRISCKLKNTGATSASAFKPSMAVLNADTRKVKEHSQGDAVTATSSGASANYERTVPANSLVVFYLYCSSAVANAETTFEELMFSISPMDMSAPEYVAFNGAKRVGNGTLKSLNGINRIMASVYDFSASFKHDFLDISTSSGGGGGGACTGIELDSSSFSLSNFEPETVGYTVTPADTSDPITWSSSDTDVFTVNDGVITATGVGTATLTVTCGNFSDTATVSVEIVYDNEYWKIGYLQAVSSEWIRLNTSTNTIIPTGYGALAADYNYENTNVSEAPILIPKGTGRIQIGYDNEHKTDLYNGSVYCDWGKNESSGASRPTAVKYVTETTFGLRTGSTNPVIITIPEGAETFGPQIRFASNIAEGVTAEQAADNVGLVITFLPAE